MLREWLEIAASVAHRRNPGEFGAKKQDLCRVEALPQHPRSEPAAP